jgi:hypothetical protein
MLPRQREWGRVLENGSAKGAIMGNNPQLLASGARAGYSIGNNDEGANMPMARWLPALRPPF